MSTSPQGLESGCRGKKTSMIFGVGVHVLATEALVEATSWGGAHAVSRDKSRLRWPCRLPRGASLVSCANAACVLNRGEREMSFTRGIRVVATMLVLSC